MSDDQPPAEELPIFNAVNFKGTSSQSLNFPIAQGVETFPSGIVFGDGTFQNTASASSGTFVQYPTAQGQVTFPSIAFADGTTQSTAATTSTNYVEFPTAQGLCSFPSGITNVGDITQATGSTTLNSTTFNGTVNQAIGSTTLLNTTINGNSTFNGNLSQTTGNCSLQAAIINGSAVINGATEVTTNFGTSSNQNFKAADSTTSRSVNLLPSVTAGAYNPATEAGNIQVLAFKSGSQGTETLELTTWSNTNSAVKIKPTSVEIGAGGTGVTGTSNIECDGSTVNVSPSLKVETNILLLEAALSSSSTLLGNSAISAGNYLTTLNPGSTSTYALQQLSAGDNGSQSIILTSGGAFGQTKNTIQSYDSYRNSTLDLYLNPLGGNVFAPTVVWPDATIQNSAFTGAGSLAGSYTSADVTIDANGKITAISNGTASAPNIVYSQWASNISFSSGFNSGTVLSVNLTPGTWQLIGVLVVNIGGGASFVPGGAVTSPFALCSINPSGSGTIAIGTIATPNNGATWSGGAQQIYTYVQTVVTITSNTTYNLQYSVSVDLTTGYMSIPNINPPTYLRAIQLG